MSVLVTARYAMQVIVILTILPNVDQQKNANQEHVSRLVQMNALLMHVTVTINIKSAIHQENAMYLGIL